MFECYTVHKLALQSVFILILSTEAAIGCRETNKTKECTSANSFLPRERMDTLLVVLLPFLLVSSVTPTASLNNRHLLRDNPSQSFAAPALSKWQDLDYISRGQSLKKVNAHRIHNPNGDRAAFPQHSLLLSRAGDTVVNLPSTGRKRSRLKTLSSKSHSTRQSFKPSLTNSTSNHHGPHEIKNCLNIFVERGISKCLTFYKNLERTHASGAEVVNGKSSYRKTFHKRLVRSLQKTDRTFSSGYVGQEKDRSHNASTPNFTESISAEFMSGYSDKDDLDTTPEYLKSSSWASSEAKSSALSQQRDANHNSRKLFTKSHFKTKLRTKHTPNYDTQKRTVRVLETNPKNWQDETDISYVDSGKATEELKLVPRKWCEPSYTKFVNQLNKLNCSGAQFEVSATSKVKYLVPDVDSMRMNGANFQRFSEIVSKNTLVRVSNLYLENSNVTDVADVFRIFDSQSILTLNLQRNGVSKLDDTTFAEAGNLDYLDLSHNSIREVTSRTFFGATKLKYLFLRNNHLTQLYNNMFLTNSLLQELHLDNNSISTLETAALAGLWELTTLYLSNNDLGDELSSHVGFFAHCHELRTLQLKNCQLHEVNKGTFLGLKNLHLLDLSCNRLTQISAGTFSELTQLNLLNLESNQFVTVSRTWSLPLSLTMLSLAHNRINMIENGAFDGIDLSIVFLNSNKLETLPTMIQLYLTARTNITLSDNPWRCDCDLVYLIHHVTSNARSDYVNITCASPRPSWMSSIRKSDIVCPVKNCYHPVCSPCPQGLQRNVDGRCLCMEGTQPTRQQLGRSGCTACPAHHYKPTPGNSQCRPCSSGSMPVSGPAPFCSCAAGYFTDDQGDCKKCPRGTFKNYVGVGPCSPCTATSSHIQQCLQDEQGTAQTLNISRKPEDNNAVLPIAAVTAGVCVLCVFGTLLLCGRQYRSKRRLIKRYMSKTNVGIDLLHFSEDETQISIGGSSSALEFRCSGRNCLRIKNIGNMIGRGAFGLVYEGYAYLALHDKEPVKVAVKRMKDFATDDEMKSMRNELDQMLNVGPHPNIIGLYGSVMHEGQLCIVMEYAELGDLLSYLKTECAFPLQYVHVGSDGLVLESSPQVEDNANLMMFAWQIAKGMYHLESNRFIHRDLAARNCLLTRGPIAKVSDFGLSKDAYELGHYRRVQKDRVPFKWLSPEALLWGQYSSKSDVWSFGILLWELYTFGGTPYPQVTTEQLRELHENGYRLSKPPACPDQLYRIMRACWRQDPRQRPAFKHLVQTLDCVIQKTRNRDYLDLHPHGLEPTNALPFTKEDMDDQITSLEFVYKNKKMNSYQSRDDICKVTNDEKTPSMNTINSDNGILYKEMFPDIDEKTCANNSNGSTITSGFLSMSSS